MNTMNTMKKLRANWGHVAHLVRDGDSRTRSALCGYYPGMHATPRAGQVQHCRWRNDAARLAAWDCPRCEKLATD